MKIGSIEILPVLDGTGREVAAEVLSRPGVADAWSCHAEHLDADGMLTLPLGGFLVRTGDRTVLVDAGVGTIDNGRYAGGRFLDALLGHGVAPPDVTDVVFTHLHFDHVGWATKKGAVVFPNATYRVHAADWAHFVESPEAEPGAVRKLSPSHSATPPREVCRACFMCCSASFVSPRRSSISAYAAWQLAIRAGCSNGRRRSSAASNSRSARSRWPVASASCPAN